MLFQPRHGGNGSAVPAAPDGRDPARDRGWASSGCKTTPFCGAGRGGRTGCGIGIINGTGFSAAAVDAFGDRMQLGGFHGCSDDFGGGQWYAERAVAAAYRSAYMGGEPTELCERIAAALQVPEAAA